MDPQDERRNRDEARAGLRHELGEVVGEDAAARAERGGALDAAIDAERPRTAAGLLNESRVLLVVAFFVALIVGAVIALVTETWWWLLVALVLHAVGTAIVVASALSLSSQTESTDPRTAAALQARGVANPDAALTQAVDAAAEHSDSERAEETRRQRTQVTPSPGSEPVRGPR
jgi:Flp pilus assembly protein TadB